MFDLSAAPRAAEAVNALGEKMSAALEDPDARVAVARVAENVREMVGTGLIDLYQLAIGLQGVPAVSQEASRVLSLLGRNPSGYTGAVSNAGLVLYRGVTGDYADCLGLSIYYPLAKDQVDREYVDLVYSYIDMGEGYLDYIYSMICGTMP